MAADGDEGKGLGVLDLTLRKPSDRKHRAG
jgi:hypothetical protein